MRTLIYSIGLNGYDLGYRSCLETQRQYAQRIGADYRVATEPTVDDPALAAWLKIPLLHNALKDGYDRVAYIDADCRVAATAPDFDDVLEVADGKICMALGRSGRVNSGVIMAHNTSQVHKFLEQVSASITQNIPAEDRANLRFENGNIIYVNSRFGGIHVMSKKWNNSSDPELDDYIRHYTGPMKSQYHPPLKDRIQYAWKNFRTPRPKSAPSKRTRQFQEQLNTLSTDVYNQFKATGAKS